MEDKQRSSMELAGREEQKQKIINNAKKDSEKNIKKIIDMFGLDPNEDIDDASIVGILDGVCDPDDDSVDLAKGARNG